MYLQVKNLSFAYDRSNPVLRDVSFSVQRGRTTAILGCSGTGKSTLLRVVAGLIRPEIYGVIHGEIQIAGLAPQKYKETGKLSFMFQESTLLPHLTVFENINLPLRVRSERNESLINSLVAKVGLANSSKKLPSQLSGGMKTRVSLARSFAVRPDLLLLDEPFTGLDVGWKSQLYRDIRLLRQQNGTTIVLVTHDIEEAIFLSDEITLLGTSGRMIDHYDLSAFSPQQREELLGTIRDRMVADYSSHTLNGK